MCVTSRVIGKRTAGLLGWPGIFHASNFIWSLYLPLTSFVNNYTVRARNDWAYAQTDGY